MWRCLLLDLRDAEASVQGYRRWHAVGSVPPAVLASIRASGIEAMDIYQLGDRLVMMMKTGSAFDPDAKAAADAADPDVVAWEALMARFQKALPSAPPDEKWLAASRIFSLVEHP